MKKYMIFDAYGTLLDINSPVKNFLKQNKNNILEQRWELLCNIWREKQISYTWLLNITNSYYDFLTVTKNSLKYALDYVRFQNKKENPSIYDPSQISQEIG